MNVAILMETARNEIDFKKTFRLFRIVRLIVKYLSNKKFTYIRWILFELWYDVTF